jgi:hypothetical protein
LRDLPGESFLKKTEKLNITFNQDLKKKEGANKYRNINKNIDMRGNKSKKKEKNKTSAIKKIEPGKPKKIKVFSSTAKNNLGHKKFIPLTSVINLVLNLLAIASTNKNEFVDNNA